MNLEEILNISGKPGLYKVISHSRGGLIVESIVDGKRMPVSINKNMSSLKDIAIYTLAGERPLVEVFEAIHASENGQKAISHKSPNAELEEYFFKVIEDYDEDRVYASDIKKVLQWYNLLHDAGLLDFDVSEKADKAADEEE